MRTLYADRPHDTPSLAFCAVYLIVIYVVVFLITVLVFWYGFRVCSLSLLGRMGLVACFLASVVALVVLIVLLPWVEPPSQRHEYGEIVIYQRPPLSEYDQAIVRLLLAVAWFIPLVLLGSLILGYLSNPESRVGRMLTGLPEPCSTERTLSCPDGVDDPSLCRLTAKTTVCGRDKVTLVYPNM